jgi:hypothetical protein
LSLRRRKGDREAKAVTVNESPVAALEHAREITGFARQLRDLRDFQGGVLLSKRRIMALEGSTEHLIQTTP